MRSNLLSSLVLLCALLPATASAQTADWSQDEARIRAASQASTEAWNRGDLKGHLAIYADDMTFMTPSGPRPGVQPIEESFSRKYFVDGKPKQTLRFEQIAIRRLGPDAALETGRFVLTGGGAPDQTGWFTLVWVRTSQGWRVIHDHSS